MNNRRKQALAAFFLPMYSRNIERIIRNPLVRMYTRYLKKTTPEFGNIDLICEYLVNMYTKNMPIDYLEFGVYKGDSIRRWSTLNSDVNSRFFGFDTFTGLPENWFSDFPKGSFNTDGSIPEITDKRVTFIKGLFQDTLYEFLRNFQKRSKFVIFVDVDLYSSALYVLNVLDKFLSSGDIIIFDDFVDPLGEFRALFDYSSSFRRQLIPIAFCQELNFVTKIAFTVV